MFFRRLATLRCLMILLGTAGAGCATAPPLDNPVHVRQSANGIENPALVSPGVPTAVSYREVFEKIIDVLDDYFEIAYANRYDGRIETVPRIAPGLEQPWKPGSPDFHQRLLATLQSIRHRAIVLIQPADNGGFFVNSSVNIAAITDGTTSTLLLGERTGSNTGAIRRQGINRSGSSPVRTATRSSGPWPP